MVHSADFRRKRNPWPWLKRGLLAVFLLFGIWMVWRYMSPPPPEAFNEGNSGKDNGGTADFMTAPITFTIRPERWEDSQWQGGRLFLRLESRGHVGKVTDLHFLEEGRKLVSASLDGTVRAWDLSRPDNPRLMATIRGVQYDSLEACTSPEELAGLKGRIHAIAHSSDWTYMAVAVSSHIRLYNLRRGELIRVLRKSGSQITALEFSPDGHFLACGGIDATVIVYPFDKYREIDVKNINSFNRNKHFFQKLPRLDGAVVSLQFSAERLAALTAAGSLQLYDCQRDFTPAGTLRRPSGAITCAAFARDGRNLLCGGKDRTLDLYSLKERHWRSWMDVPMVPSRLCFSPADREVLVGGLDEAGVAHLVRYTFPNGLDRGEFTLNGSPISALTSFWGAGGTWWATADAFSHTISVWNEEGEKSCSIGSDFAQVTNVQVSADGVLGLSIADATFSCFDLKTLRRRSISSEDQLESARIAAGPFLITTGEVVKSDLEILQGLVALQITRNGTPVGQILSGSLNGFAHRLTTFVKESLLVCGGDDGQLLVFDLSGNLLARLDGCEGDILSLASSTKGNWLAASAADHTIRVWDLSFLDKIAQKGLKYGEDTQSIMKSAFWSMKSLGYPDDAYKALQAEANLLFTRDTEDWRALMQYLRLLNNKNVKRVPPTLSLALLDRNDWVAWIPLGFVAFSSPHTIQKLVCQAEMYRPYNVGEPDTNIVPFGSVYDAFFRPDLVQLSVNDPEQFREYKKANGTYETISEALLRNPPPQVTILEPKSGERSEGVVTKLKVKITDNGGGIGDVRVYLNGKIISSKGVFRAVKEGSAPENLSVAEERRVVRGEDFHTAGKEQEKTLSIPLVPGKNIISCAAMNYRNSVLSAMEVVEVTSTLPEVRPRLFALAIGVNTFRNSKYNLSYANYDALDIAQKLKENGDAYYRETIVKTLLDPTKVKLMEALQEIASQVKATDAFVFFASSHGGLREDRLFLITADFDGGEVGPSNSLSSDEIMELTMKMPALQQVIILDTCYSGSSGWTFRDLYESRMQFFSLGSGLHLLTASSPYSFSLEGYNQHGVFSYFLLEALAGEADFAGDQDGRTTVTEVSRYVQDKVKAITFSYQEPIHSEYGKDVVLVDRRKSQR